VRYPIRCIASPGVRLEDISVISASDWLIGTPHDARSQSGWASSLHENGRIRPISLRALFFLIAHGAAAPFTLARLARRFDNTDPLDPDQVAEQAALTADVITSGLRLHAPGRGTRSYSAGEATGDSDEAAGFAAG
jgi:hypothetical protein